MIPDLKKWHATDRERRIDPTVTTLIMIANGGTFAPHERFNVDQSPLRFAVNIKKTYDYVEPGKSSEHNTWIIQPGS